MLERLDVAARHDVTILLIGETGSGKTHLARLIHESSERRKEPFLTVACGALPRDLIESELFGHVKGAFTGADRNRKGRFEAAGGGDIFLDEIGDIPLSTQVKLLRVLQEKEIEKVGDHKPLSIDVRFITATNKDLKVLMEEGRFRDRKSVV